MSNKIRTLIICVLLFFLCISICFHYFQNRKVEKLENDLLVENSAYPEIYNIVNSVSYNNFELFLEDDRNSKTVVYIGRPTCSDCTIFEPAFITFINEFNLSEQIIYLNVTELRKDETKWKDFQFKYGLKYTPSIAIFENSKVTSKIEWTPENGISINSVKKWFILNELISN